MSDDVVAEQVDYYRRRAAEYDATSHGDLSAAIARIERLVDELAPTGRILEIACGTGMWTQVLGRRAELVTALDASPEAIAIARDRVHSVNVTFEIADVFTWPSAGRYDVVFFAFWLSHVPSARFADFWGSLGDRLTDGGRVIFIDEHVDEQDKETYVGGDAEMVERRLSDGSAFSIVKNFVDPRRMEVDLARLGWTATVRRSGDDWVVGEARQ